MKGFIYLVCLISLSNGTAHLSANVSFLHRKPSLEELVQQKARRIVSQYAQGKTASAAEWLEYFYTTLNNRINQRLKEKPLLLYIQGAHQGLLSLTPENLLQIEFTIADASPDAAECVPGEIETDTRPGEENKWVFQKATIALPNALVREKEISYQDIFEVLETIEHELTHLEQFLNFYVFLCLESTITTQENFNMLCPPSLAIPNAYARSLAQAETYRKSSPSEEDDDALCEHEAEEAAVRFTPFPKELFIAHANQSQGPSFYINHLDGYFPRSTFAQLYDQRLTNQLPLKKRTLIQRYHYTAPPLKKRGKFALLRKRKKVELSRKVQQANRPTPSV